MPLFNDYQLMPSPQACDQDDIINVSDQQIFSGFGRLGFGFGGPGFGHGFLGSLVTSALLESDPGFGYGFLPYYFY